MFPGVIDITNYALSATQASPDVKTEVAFGFGAAFDSEDSPEEAYERSAHTPTNKVQSSKATALIH